MRLYHITTQADWEAAQLTGQYSTPSLEMQGFIHLSQVGQVARVANAIYRGQTGLVVLCINPDTLAFTVRYEPPDPTIPGHHYEGELFPHLYGPLHVSAVVDVVDLEPDAEGEFTFLG